MARKPKVARRDTLSVSVTTCRVRMQTGEPIVFLDVRKDEDRAANPSQIAGSLRIVGDDRAFQPPCHQHNYIVVYCA
jgi:hypothetical protein